MLRKIFGYGTLAIISVLIQLILITYAVSAGGRIPAVGFFYHLVTLSCIFYILNSSMPDSYKLCWVIPMLCLPLYGGVYFLLFSKKHSVNAIHYKMRPYLTSSMKEIMSLPCENGIQHYLAEHAGFPLTVSEESRYFPMGEELFEEMLKKISEAEEYIFIEFFIISEGAAWTRMEKLLSQKASEGVKVRIIADDAGCLFVKPKNFKKRLISMGIEYREFNPVSLRVTGRVNYRNHRKILVCDGKYAFCCGINIADEYMNYKKRFGKWKDTGIMVSDGGAQSFTAMFCGMWNYLSGEKEKTFIDFQKYERNPADSLIQPFSETPLDNEAVGLRTYLSLINEARTSVYLTTPYLICDNEMLGALEYAAKRGVRVCIITPGVPDKKYVYTLTRSHYKSLIPAGVEIYEYTPGFIHAKTLVIDEKTAVAGTINFDYRSMFMLFECACVFYGGNIADEITSDFLQTVKVCRRINYEEVSKTGALVRIARGFLRLFAPLM